MATRRKWHKGPPPHVGWWNASVFRSKNAWRWWDGTFWSAATFSMFSGRTAGLRAQIKDSGQKYVEWSDYYPPNARVPRIAP